MGKSKSIIIKLLISAASIIFFWGLESGFSQRQGDELVKSIIFAISLFFVLTRAYKKLVMFVSLILLSVMVVLYLFGQIYLSNMVGSVGFGVLLIYTLSFLPELIRGGNVVVK